LAQNYSIGQAHFVALYLLSHGTIKLGLVIGLLKGRMWVYPVAIVVFGFFVLFETYLVVVKRSPLVALLLVLDIFLIVFIRREYKNLRSRRDGDRRENLPNLA
jgi:uncharacterized membrane protein